MTRGTLTFLHATILTLIVVTNVTSTAHRTKRLAGGKDAGPTEFPYQVSLRYYGLHVCGGALTSVRHVLSAAHCVCEIIDDPSEELTVVTGTVKLGKTGENHPVEKITCHPDYKFGLKSSWSNDIVVITLVENVRITESQSPIALPTFDTHANVPAVITGWGRSDTIGPLHKNLQKLAVRTLGNDACQKYYDNAVLTSQICTLRGKGVGACKGDSGSPLVSNDTLVGIFSWTKPCAIGSPDVFSRVYYFLDFIKNATRSD